MSQKLKHVRSKSEACAEAKWALGFSPKIFAKKLLNFFNGSELIKKFDQRQVCNRNRISYNLLL